MISLSPRAARAYSPISMRTMLLFAIALSARPRSCDRAAMDLAFWNLSRAAWNRLFLTSAYPIRIRRLNRVRRSGVTWVPSSFAGVPGGPAGPARSRPGEVDEILDLFLGGGGEGAVDREDLMFRRRDISGCRKVEEFGDVHLEDF